jgi:hypothetical protein
MLFKFNILEFLWVNCAYMGSLSTYQCVSYERIFYFLGNHFVVRGSVDDVPRSAGCFACEYLLNLCL